MARLQFSVESIDFQHDDTGERLEALFQQLVDFIQKKNTETKNRDLVIKIIQRSNFSNEFSDYCQKRFGLNIFFDFSNTVGSPFVECLAINSRHIFVDKMWHGEDVYEYEKAITKKLEGQKGTIDLKHAKVSGLFSKHRHRLAMNVYELVIDHAITVKQLVAVALHEIGHLFTWYEYSDRLTSTNQVIANLATEIRTEDRPDKREYWFRELAEQTNTPAEEFHDLINEKNRVILGYRLYEFYLNHATSQLAVPKYDETSSEQLADNFAARFGYGRYIVEFLHRYETDYGSPNVSGTSRFIFSLCEIFGLMGQGFIFIANLIYGGPVGVIYGLFYLWILFIGTYCSGEKFVDMTYDDLKTRYRRLRHQSIQRLKDQSISPELTQILIEDIKQMDAFEKRVVVYESLLRRLSNLLFKVNRDTRADIEKQKVIEELLHNDLYLKSAQLKLLTPA